MTTIVGLVETDGTIWLGADRRASAGGEIRDDNGSKIFQRDALLLAATGTIRYSQLLEHQLKIPAHPDGERDLTYLVSRFVPAVRAMLKDHGYLNSSDGRDEVRGDVMIGYRGNLYVMMGDFAVNHLRRPIEAIGSGSEYALGALAARADLGPLARLQQAVLTAAQFDIYTGTELPHIASLRPDGTIEFSFDAVTVRFTPSPLSFSWNTGS